MARASAEWRTTSCGFFGTHASSYCSGDDGNALMLRDRLQMKDNAPPFAKLRDIERLLRLFYTATGARAREHTP